MACDVFIQISGVDGESTDDQHRGWIEVTQFDFNVRQKVSQTASSAGGASAERADFSESGFPKLLDKTSPLLAMACAAGTHFDTIVVELCRAGGHKVRFMRYTFANCMISAFNTSSDGDFPEDDVSFVYGKVEWCYTRQQRAGGWAAGNVACAWSLEKNCRAKKTITMTTERSSICRSTQSEEETASGGWPTAIWAMGTNGRPFWSATTRKPQNPAGTSGCWPSRIPT